MFFSVLISLLLLHLTASASVKREEYSGSSSSSSSASSHGNSNPVYSPSINANSGYLSSASGAAGNGANTASNAAINSYLSNYANYGSSSGNSNPSYDQLTSASANGYQTGGSQGSPNLYYYYYPVQDKQKETTFQTSASNQYPSAVTPNNNNLDTSSGSIDNVASSSGGQDLSYGAQGEGQYSGQSDMYNGQSSQASSGNNNYDQTLGSLASQLQQYGYGQSAGNQGYNPGYQAASSYGSGNAYGMSGDSSASAYNPAAAAAAGGLTGSSYPSVSDPSTLASLAGSFQGYGPQSGLYGMQGSPYAAYGNMGSYAAASNQQATYEQPAASPPSSGYRKYGIGSIIMPMLALAGLSLLIPTVTSLSTAAGRKKRSIPTDAAKESALGEYLDRIDRYYALYKTAVERDECMNRIICELGDSMGIAKGRVAFLNFAEKFTPLWLSKRITALKSSAVTNDKPGKCKKYSCQ